MSKEKVGILTRTSASNSGTLLQNYALQQAILRMGYDAETVSDELPRKLFSKKKTEIQRGLKVYLYGKYDQWKTKRENKEETLREKRCQSFKKKNIRCFSLTDLDELNRRYRTLISGSDQIWAQPAEPELYGYFMQNTVSPDVVKASYAVSVGADYAEDARDNVRKYLSDFDYISVREKTSEEIIKKYTDKKIVMACDPVLLFPTDFWQDLSNKRKIAQPYIYCHFLSDHPWYFEKTAELFRQMDGVQVYVHERFPRGGHPYQQAQVYSPEDFLSYIQYADYVLTDSYHAFLFSLLFERNVIALERFSGEVKNVQNGRLLFVADKLGIRDRYMKKDEEIRARAIDYAPIRERIEAFRQESEAYLREVLSYRKDKTSDG